MDKSRYLKDGEVIKTALNKRDFTRDVVINQFTQEDIRDLLNTININNELKIVNERVEKVNESGYKASFGIEYNFPTESSALLFKTINKQLTNSGRTSETLKLEKEEKKITINISQSNNGYISSLQTGNLKLNKTNALNKESIILGSEIFTDTISNLMSSGIYDFFNNQTKNKLVASRIVDGDTFDKYERKFEAIKHGGFLKACIQGHLIEHDEIINSDIVQAIRSVEHKLLKQKQNYSEMDIKLSGQNFEIGQKINNLQALQIDICQICSPSQKVDKLNMQEIRKIIKLHSEKDSKNDDFIPIDQESNREEVRNGVFNVLNEIKNNALKVINIAMNSKGEITNSENAPRVSKIDPSKHNIKNKYT